MKRTIILGLSLFIAGLTGTISVNAQKFSANTEKSTVKWIGEKVTREHFGSIKLKSGDLTVENGKISSAAIVMDMTSITVEDMEGEYADKLQGHLKSPDFFNVADFNTSTFALTDFKEKKSANGNYEITGTLTIKGITHSISFPAQVDITGNSVVAKADLTFDRTKYEIRYNSGSFFDDLGDYMIYDDVKISFELHANS
jgi:polyisoprenoid-binding protein YceI